MREIYIKTLRLVPAEYVNRLGMPAEAPTFVSPIIDTRRPCLICRRTTYAPLVYQTGYVTTAHHYHHCHSGGIYCFLATSPSFLASIAELTGFVAQVEPIGKMNTQVISGDICARAEAVRTTRIMAFCLHPATSRGLTSHPRGIIALEEGILLTRPTDNSAWRRVSTDTQPGDLLPLCGPDELVQQEHAPFSFHIRDGTVSMQHRPFP
jgi:hypothetical protein